MENEKLRIKSEIEYDSEILGAKKPIKRYKLQGKESSYTLALKKIE